MDSASATEFKITFHFTVNTATLDETSVNSSEIKLSGVPWTILLRKNPINGKATKFLSIHLVSAFDRSSDKSCDAQAVFKLLHKDGENDKSVIKHLPKKTFDNENLSRGIEDFIEWNDFLQHHVDDEKQAKFEIDISTNPLKRKRKASRGVDRMSSNFHVSIKPAHTLDKGFWTTISLQDIQWKILCQKNGQFLRIFLYGTESDMDENWSYKVTVTFNLVSFNSNVKPITRKFVQVMQIGTSSWGFSKFLKWSEYVDEKNAFISKDVANLFVELEVDDPIPKWKFQRNTISNTGLSLECNICTDGFPSGNIFSLKCGHLFCKPCLRESLKLRKECPKCRVGAFIAQMHPIYF